MPGWLAKNAEQAVNDVAAGVKQGLHSDNTPAGSSRLDLNSASEADLASLPRNFTRGKRSRSSTIGLTPPPMTW